MSLSDNEQVVTNLEPQTVWQYFAGIAATPRPSKHEERIRDHMKQVAESRGFAWSEDGAGNLVIKAPASPGKENAPTVVLQGHLDMVCEKNSGTEHDFDNEGVRFVLADDGGEQVLRADGTTLGADNGLGVALALAVASDPDAVHGPLEILCTVDEEAGMTGARALKPGFFDGKLLINLDSEEDDILYIGCAGGGDTLLTWSFDRQPFERNEHCLAISVSGLRGGHSGGNIHENRGNANKVLATLLESVLGEEPRLISISGGSKRNALAREARASLAGTPSLREELQQNLPAVLAEARERFGEAEASIDISETECPADAAAVSVENTRRLVWALLALPHGVLEVHPTEAGLIQTSNNLATITSETEALRSHVRVGLMSRSSADGAVEGVQQQVAAIGNLAGATVEVGGAYPGWQPNFDAPLLATCQGVYAKLFGEIPQATAIHAGLECGIIGERVAGLDMISMGPRITGAHSPDEQAYVASVGKAYRLLRGVLAELAR